MPDERRGGRMNATGRPPAKDRPANDQATSTKPLDAIVPPRRRRFVRVEVDRGPGWQVVAWREAG